MTSSITTRLIMSEHLPTSQRVNTLTGCDMRLSSTGTFYGNTPGELMDFAAWLLPAKPRITF